MGGIKFSIRMLLIDKKTCIAYILSIASGFMVLYNIFNLYFIRGIITNNTKNDIALGIVIIVITGIILLLGYYSNSFFLDRRGKEVAVEMISGVNLASLSINFLVQNIILSGLSIIVGLLLGILTSPLIVKIAYFILEENGNIFLFSKDAIFCTIALVFTQIVFLALVDVGMGHRTEICNLIKRSEKRYNPKKNSIGILGLIISLILYLFPIIILLFLDYSDSGVYVMIQISTIVGGFGLVMLIIKSIPYMIEKIVENKFMCNSKLLIVFRNLKYMIEKSNIIIMSFSILITLLSIFIGEYKFNKEFSLISMIGLVLTIFLLIITLVYKIIVEAINRVNTYNQVYLLGYAKVDIKKIINLESMLYFSVIFLLPYIQCTFMLLAYVRGNIITTELGVAIIVVLIPIYLITTLICTLIYKYIVFKYCKVLGGRDNG